MFLTYLTTENNKQSQTLHRAVLHQLTSTYVGLVLNQSNFDVYKIAKRYFSNNLLFGLRTIKKRKKRFCVTTYFPNYFTYKHIKIFFLREFEKDRYDHVHALKRYVKYIFLEYILREKNVSKIYFTTGPIYTNEPYDK